MTPPPGNGKSPTLTDRLFHLGGELAYIVTLSFVWLILAIPLVTIPAATAGVYGTIGVHVVDGGREYLAPFKMAFTRSFRRVTLIGVGLLVLISVAGFNVFYYFWLIERTTMTTVLGAVQIALAAGAVVLLGFYLLLVGLHYARGHVGPAPTFRETAAIAWQNPLSATMVLIVSIGFPLVVILMYLWQFSFFIIGAVCYANIWLLLRLGLPDLAPEF